MKRLAGSCSVLCLVSCLASGCTAPGSSAPAGGTLPGQSSPNILQGNNGSPWTTIAGLGNAAPYPANVLAADKMGSEPVVTVLASWTQSTKSYVSLASIDMNGNVSPGPNRPLCRYPGSKLGTYQMYAYDVAFNANGYSVFLNRHITFRHSKEKFGWLFINQRGSRNAQCSLVNVRAGNVTVLARGPDYTIFGAGPESTYLWRFAVGGGSKHFQLPSGVSAFDSLVEGPGHDMWAQPANTQTVMRIDPRTGNVLHTYDIPCDQPAYALTAVKGLLWGFGRNCVYSISGSGKTSSYTVNGLVPENAPHAIAAGADGNPWFIDVDKGSELGTVDRKTGTSTIVPLPSGASYGVGLGTGPDQNIWIVDEDTNVYVYAPHPLSVSPASVTLSEFGEKANLTVTEVGKRRWTATPQDAHIAVVRKTSHNDVFSVEAKHTGSTTITISDNVGNSVVVPVTVE